MQGEVSAKILLDLLSAVDQNSHVTQRSVARDLNIALGLANAYLKRCVNKGLIKVRQIPRNRYAYYLTPKGFSEKSRLTAEYLSQSFSLYRQARQQYDALFRDCAARGWHRVALAGLSDLSEIAQLYGKPSGVAVVGIVDRNPAQAHTSDLPVVSDLGALGAVDAVLVTDLADPQGMYDFLVGPLPADRVLIPKLLGIERRAMSHTP